MRPSPTKNQMKAREMFLECHRPKIVHDYMLPISDLHFDESVTELMLGNEYIGKAVFELLSTREEVERMAVMRRQHKERLQAELSSPNGDYRHGWDTHLDYESLVMDKMIDLERIPPGLLITPSGRTFYVMQTTMRLMHQGYQLARHEPNNERSAWFSQWDDQWYFKHALTKYRLIDILQQYYDAWIGDFANENVPVHSSVDETFEAMREFNRQRVFDAMRAKEIYKKFIEENPDLKNYARFVAEAMEYNEELRSLRSQSVFNFIQGCKRSGVEPYKEFLDVLAERQTRIEKMYGG